MANPRKWDESNIDDLFKSLVIETSKAFREEFRIMRNRLASLESSYLDLAKKETLFDIGLERLQKKMNQLSNKAGNHQHTAVLDLEGHGNCQHLDVRVAVEYLYKHLGLEIAREKAQKKGAGKKT